MQSFIRYGFTISTTLLLAGCVMGTGASGPQGTDAPRGAAATAGEIEAPNAYALTDTGLWDGRPSLGGTWIAVADVKDPDHVLIRNLANGKSVSGALFRRERANPGPRIQVSSDAAQALGMLAGAPVKLSVVALRKAEPAKAAEAAVASGAKSDAKVPAAAAKAAPAASPVAGAAKATAPVTAPAPAAPAPAAAAPAATSSASVLLGTFGVEANARAVADRLGRGGIAATISPAGSKDKPLWRVLARPATGESAQDLLRKVKGLGFADAYIATK